MPQRKHLPPATRHQVLMEAGYKCGNPTCRHILTLELHHIVWVKDGGGNDSWNLLALCPNCHSLHTHSHIPQSAIRHWKGMLIALNHAFDHESTDLLLFLHHTGPNSLLWYSADGVLKFARLIAANLVCFGQQVGPIDTSTSRHQLALTESGRLLVEAWLAGDEGKYRQHLTSTI